MVIDQRNRQDLYAGAGVMIPEAYLFKDYVDEPELPLVERVLQAFETHANAEADSLATYEDMAENSPDPVVRLFMNLVFDDEKRHHAMTERMAARLRDDLQWTHSAGALPAAMEGHGKNPAVAAKIVKQLAEEEHQGVQHLSRLAHEVSGLHEGMLSLMVEMMALDSAKHEKVMRYLAKRLERYG